MKILAVEFSSDRRSVAVVSDDKVLGTAAESGVRATPAIGLITAALTEAGMEREAIECVAVGLGPGSYAGIRSAIALAQGWQLASGEAVKLLGVSSATCLAAQAQSQGWFGTVDIVIDAQRNELYLAGFQITAETCREIQSLKLATTEEARARLSAGALMVGPEVTRWFDSGRTLSPEAAMLGRLARLRSNFVRGQELEPIYLRPTAFLKIPRPG